MAVRRSCVIWLTPYRFGLTMKLVFLGDYIDRGPDSSGVVSFLIELNGSP